MTFLSQAVNQSKFNFYHIDATNLDWFIRLTGVAAGVVKSSGERQVQHARAGVGEQGIQIIFDCVSKT